jgi:hypothetical protein
MEVDIWLTGIAKKNPPAIKKNDGRREQSQ